MNDRAEDTRPVLAVTLGDPAGIGPEIVVGTLAQPDASPLARGIAVGDARVLRRAAEVCGIKVELNPVTSVDAAVSRPGVIDVLDLAEPDPELPRFGEVQASGGRAALRAIETATSLAMSGDVDAVVTSPINKEAVWAAGSSHLGHTELLAELTGSASSSTMFLVRGLKIFFTTRHTSLRKALDQITLERVTSAIDDAYQALQVFGHDQPRLAVAAVNPHAGESGAFGDEEQSVLIPAVEAAKARGMDVSGPVPVDTVFHHGLSGKYHGVLCHFHDHGHIAAKTYDFDGTVSVTTGIPILRTSVDHGTAFDIAGTGRASYETMVAAYRAAAE
ncbi:MAG: 4-hydroxythreonine-4-phosphate dehydrogenase PdxA, partial [Micromonosporaceae bacterium]